MSVKDLDGFAAFKSVGGLSKFSPGTRLSTSRRGFLSGLLAAGAAGTALELRFGGRAWAAGTSPSSPSSSSAQPVDGHDALDVLVVGTGIAGFSAACAAKEAGAKTVLMIEKGPLVGGHSIYSSGSIAVVTPRTKPYGLDDSPELFTADALIVGGGLGDEAILMKMARGSHNAFEWLESMNVRFGAPFVAHSGLHRRCFAMPGNNAGRSYVLALAARARSLGISWRLNAKLTGLSRTRHGWAVAIEEPGGAAEERSKSNGGNASTGLRLMEARTVILATGGFTADVKRRMRVNPRLTSDLRTTANPYGTTWDGATGDGIDLAARVGGAVKTGYGLQVIPFWGGRLLDYVGGDIYLTPQGKRFVDETRAWDEVAEAMLSLPEKECWVVTDRQSMKGATLGLKLINGIVRKAESVEALAEGMEVPVDVLRETLDDYNRAVRNGYEPVTGKCAFAQTISVPPFYYGKERIYVHTSLDGVATDSHARVVDADGRPIPGFYAAGEVVGGIFGRERLGGAQLTNCLVMGRTAGREAAGVETGD